MAFCRDCGNDIGTDKFCSKCGTEDKANPKTKPRIIDRSEINKYCEGYFKEMANDKKSLIIESDIPLYLNAIDKLDDEQFQSFRKELTRRRKVTELNKLLNIDIEITNEMLSRAYKNKDDFKKITSYDEPKEKKGFRENWKKAPLWKKIVFIGFILFLISFLFPKPDPCKCLELKGKEKTGGYLSVADENKLLTCEASYTWAEASKACDEK